MDPGFWHQRWEKNEIAFHESAANQLLVRHFDELSLAPGSRIFVPLCGKSLDVSWLLSKGCRVAGAELSPLAVEQLFKGLGLQAQVSRLGEVERRSAKDLDIFVGDIFALSRQMLGPVDAVYDRAALVAFPEDMRKRYAAHLMELTNRAPQLLICYDYDQSQQQGPPFSVSHEEVRRHYAARYRLTLIENRPVPGGLKGKCPANENVWLLRT